MPQPKRDAAPPAAASAHELLYCMPSALKVPLGKSLVVAQVPLVIYTLKLYEEGKEAPTAHCPNPEDTILVLAP